jgi:hypothetical protein
MAKTGATAGHRNQSGNKRNQETYGPERLQSDLAERGIQVGRFKIKRIH